ncbi:hypothetical protein [Thiorhodococcus minor]|uniref:Uncharacterized protein n=1 Tax=Thiorhodococcus minor TaxID=57489 RepID=A0A6M0JUJ3_9GAMM|nr:hypothetical protein [Thiorhodococcus minor]NEV61208.1 hypothetical protein [Thiorhodococcus minor]
MRFLPILASCSTLAGLSLTHSALADSSPLAPGSYSLERPEISSTLSIEFKHGQGVLLSAEAVLLSPSAHYGIIEQAPIELPHEDEAHVGIYRGQGCVITLRGTPDGLHAQQDGRCEEFGAGVWLTGDYVRTTPHYDDIRLGEVDIPEPDKAGLFVARFRVTYYPPRGGEPMPQSHSYRIYCPTRMVRNIGNTRWDEARKVEEEDERRFAGIPVVGSIVARVCDQDL